MKTKEIILQIEETDGLDMNYIKDIARRKNCTVKNYITEYVKNYYNCSRYIANRVATYYIEKYEGDSKNESM